MIKHLDSKTHWLSYKWSYKNSIVPHNITNPKERKIFLFKCSMLAVKKNQNVVVGLVLPLSLYYARHKVFREIRVFFFK